MQNKNTDKKFQEKIKKNILILGSGFGGVEAARTLGKYSRYFNVTILSDNPNFLYYPALYQLISKNKTHFSQLLVNKMVPPNVKILLGKITGFNPDEKKVVTSIGDVSYDTLIVALGSSTADYGVPGVFDKMNLFRSFEDAEKLREVVKNHLQTDRIEPIIIVGGGPVGIELASYIASINTQIYGTDGKPHVMIVEGNSRIAVQLSENTTKIVTKRLSKIFSSICLNTRVISYDGKILKTSKGDFISDTVIWSAGLVGNKLLKDFGEVDKRGRLVVDEFLAIPNLPDVYAIGDSASTKNSGLAQTAIEDGIYIAHNIILKEERRKIKKYKIPFVAYALPVGYSWAIVDLGRFSIYGYLGHLIREFIDYKYLLTHLSWRALRKDIFGQ